MKMAGTNDIEDGFERAWSGMLSRPSFKFRNLNQAEIAGLKGMFHDIYIAQINTAKLAVSQSSPMVDSGLKDLISEGFSKMQSALANVRVAGVSAGASVPFSAELTPELLASMFETSGMRTNIDDVKMQSKSIKGTGNVADKLRKLRGGS
jgi:hypothetical protein